jgi:hypothetical protein
MGAVGNLSVDFGVHVVGQRRGCIESGKPVAAPDIRRQDSENGDAKFDFSNAKLFASRLPSLNISTTQFITNKLISPFSRAHREEITMRNGIGGRRFGEHRDSKR